MFENDSNQKLIDRPRRKFLKAIGGGTALTLSAGGISAGSGDRTGATQEVPHIARETQSSISNTIRDANNGINFSTDGGAIRNVGFQNRRSAGDPLVAAAVPSSGGSAVIEGCYFGDGGSGPAIFVTPSHAGTLVIRNCYFEGWGDNAIYGSPPGNPSEHSTPGSGGVVKVENCYSKGNAISNFRLGTDGSYIKNCVSVGGQRGYWGFYGTTRVINCDIHSGILASASEWQAQAVVNVENTRFSGGTHLHYSGATINGTSQGQPRDYYPGVPLSATDAKNGNMNG